MIRISKKAMLKKGKIRVRPKAEIYGESLPAKRGDVKYYRMKK